VGRFTPSKGTRYPLHRGLCGLQVRSGQAQKISTPPEFDPRTVQPIASRYTNWGSPAQNCWNRRNNNRPICLLKASSCTSQYFFSVMTLCGAVDRYEYGGGKYRSMDSHYAGCCKPFHRNTSHHVPEYTMSYPTRPTPIKPKHCVILQV